MKITKAKLIKGAYLEVIFTDGDAEVVKRYAHTESPPKLVKAFMSLNSHVCELTEQYDATGQGDYDNIACRGYSIKGSDEKEGVVLTGVRTLKSGRSILLNTPFVSTDISDSSYPKIKGLVESIERCHDEIVTFMDNNETPGKVQGRLQFTPKENFIVQSEATAAARGESDLPPETQAVVAQILKEQAGDEDPPMTEQEIMDEEMPLTVEMLQANNARKNSRKKKEADKK